MNHTLSKLYLPLFIAAPLLTSHRALAVDIEIDPFAYALNGHSVHLGFGNENFRFDIGSYGLEIPESFHDNENFEQEFSGYGVKLDYLFGQYEGLFVGIQAGDGEYTYTHTSSQETTKRSQFSIGPRIGYRFVYNNITITPWIAVEFNVDNKDVELNGDTFESDEFTVFPTVHIGYRF